MGSLCILQPLCAYWDLCVYDAMPMISPDPKCVYLLPASRARSTTKPSTRAGRWRRRRRRSIPNRNVRRGDRKWEERWRCRHNFRKIRQLQVCCAPKVEPNVPRWRGLKGMWCPKYVFIEFLTFLSINYLPITSVTRSGNFWTLGNFLKPLATINLPKSPNILRQYL